MLSEWALIGLKYNLVDNQLCCLHVPTAPGFMEGSVLMPQSLYLRCTSVWMLYKKKTFLFSCFFPICLEHSCGILMQQKYYFCVLMWYKAVRSKGGHQFFLSGSLKQHGHWWGIRPDGSLSSSDELLTITLGNSFQNAFWRELMNFMVTDILMDTRQGHGLGYLHCKAVMWNSPLYAGNMFFITIC